MITQLIIIAVMELMLIMGLIIVAKSEILVGIKTKLLKGYARLIIVGNDNTLRIIPMKISMKKDDITTLKIGAGTYLIDPTKMFLQDRTPTWIYKEGISDPIDPRSIHLKVGLDAETQASLLAKARLSGQIPHTDDMKDKLMFIATLVGAGASCVAVMLLLRMGGIA
jgi:hypothetical protein